ncbi:glycosyltransferase family 2 protein [Yersinia alsatica]|uniref:Glycosyltransferase family 2 protein n=1 Tax=Yersinia alsatica TaxID=2890317 RepID=A0ABY5US48_9GAMM|nr:glycosyltransferase family 2 protein [Yersinia alsatica]OWF69787.1 glycosyl transferase [Yersinia frederiksenii]UWM46318.1 glycosyltransferase family 2 protein [Yersinia alsatica]
MPTQHLNNVAILLGSRNGAKFLPEQLMSFQRQTYPNWSLWVSDDGSTDNTKALVTDFIERSGADGHLLDGPQHGFCQNFMSLVTNPAIKATYYAFSDQDDVWLEDKLERAVDWLNTVDSTIPALYCSRTCLIDSKGKPIGYSPDYAKPPGFGNALLQNIASGNTMVFNHCARELLQKVKGAPIIVHDWSLYQIVTGCGGVVNFDRQPSVRYRQHQHNIIGNSMSPLRRLSNFLAAYGGRAAKWNDANVEVLTCISNELTPRAKQMLASFCAIRGSNVLNRLRLMRESDVYHQQRIGTLTTLMHILLNKM